MQTPTERWAGLVDVVEFRKEVNGPLQTVVLKAHVASVSAPSPTSSSYGSFPSSPVKPLDASTLPPPTPPRQENQELLQGVWDSAAECFEPLTLAAEAVLEQEYPMRSVKTVQGIYGVISVGVGSVLVLITGRLKVASLPLGHSVYQLTSVDTLELPCGGSGYRTPEGGVSEETRGTPQFPGSSAAAPASPSTVLADRSKAWAQYEALLKQFFRGSSKMKLYVSYSVDLTLPMEKSLVDSAPVLGASAGVNKSGSLQSVDEWGFAKDSEAEGPISHSHPLFVPPRELFHWNGKLTVRFSMSLLRLVSPAVRGYVGTASVRQHVSEVDLNVVLICRSACTYAGTRYNRRGLDRNGVPGNFAETEQVVWSTVSNPTGNRSRYLIQSYKLLRGSVPLHWSQPPNFSYRPDPQVPKQDEVLAAGLQAHHRLLNRLYPNVAHVFAVDLMNPHSHKEGPLSEAYAQAVTVHGKRLEEAQKKPDSEDPDNLKELASPVYSYHAFNLGKYIRRNCTVHLENFLPQSHANPSEAYSSTCLQVTQQPKTSSVSKKLFQKPQTPHTQTPNSQVPSLNLSGSATSAKGETHVALRYGQSFLFRINCLDCLDRSNITQSVISQIVLRKQVRAVLAFETAPSPMKDGNRPRGGSDNNLMSPGSGSGQGSGSAPQFPRTASGNPCGGDTVQPSTPQPQNAPPYDPTVEAVIHELTPLLRELWVEHGNALSDMYAGTPALLADVVRTGKRTFLGGLRDGWKSTYRYFQQHFLDGKKQDAVTLASGAHDPTNLQFSDPFSRRISYLNLLVFGGTTLALGFWFLTAFVLLKYSQSPRWWMAAFMELLWTALLAYSYLNIRKEASTYVDHPVLTSC
jgi:hypothetical protein